MPRATLSTITSKLPPSGAATYLTPIVKGWCTEIGQEITSLGVQVHGGMGYVEETGAAQYLRDARITTIYEGTTGIQALDLVGRKTLRDGGVGARELIGEMQDVANQLTAAGDHRLQAIGAGLADGCAMLEAAVAWLLETSTSDPQIANAAAVHYLNLWGTVAGCWQLGDAALRSANALAQGDSRQAFLETKIETAYFYARQILPRAETARRAMIDGSESAMRLDAANF